MADPLTELYDNWKKAHPNPVEFQVWQGAFTTSAASMRTRAMEACRGKIDVNEIINAIGRLSDIP